MEMGLDGIDVGVARDAGRTRVLDDRWRYGDAELEVRGRDNEVLQFNPGEMGATMWVSTTMVG